MFFWGRKWLLPVLAGLLIWLQAVSALAAPAGEKKPVVTVKATGAFGNHAKQGAWLPLQVEVTNNGPDLQGKLRLVYSNKEEFLADYTSKAVVPRGATKRFDMYVPVNQFLGGLRVEVVTDQGTVAKGKVDINFHSFDQPVIGVLERPDSDFGALTGVRLPNGNSPVLITLKHENFPDKAELLAFFDALVIADVNLQLNDGQAGALVRWVNQGGNLILAGGPGWAKVLPGLPTELRPVEVTGTAAKKLDSLPLIMGKGSMQPPAGLVQVANIGSAKGKGIYVDAGEPLAIEQSVGSGKVVFLSFDPFLEPLAGWGGTKFLWQDLLIAGRENMTKAGYGGVGFKGLFGGNNSWALSEALNTIPAMELPSLKGTVVLLVLYVFMVGFLNYLILKKLDKREWAWFTVPALAFVFVAVIYLASFQERRSEVLSHQINIVDLHANNTLAKVTTLTGIFAPNRSKYVVDLKGKQLVYALPANGEPPMQVSGKMPAARVMVEQNAETTKIELRDMRSWMMRGFGTAGETNLKGGLVGEITRQDKKWLGVITNNTEYDFTDGLLLSPFGYKKVGAIKAGGKITVEIPVQKVNQLNTGMPFYHQIYNPAANWQGQGIPPRQSQQDMLRQRVLESLFSEEGGQVNNGRLLFLGWSDQQVRGALTLQDEGIKKYYTSLFKTSLSLRTDPNNLQVPPGFINGRLMDSKNVGIGPGTIHLQPNSEVVYQLELPAGKFDQLQLHLQMPGGPNWDGYLYNWDKESWEAVRLTTGSNTIKEHVRYVNKNRLVRFKIINHRDSYEITGVSIALSSKGGGKQ